MGLFNSEEQEAKEREAKAVRENQDRVIRDAFRSGSSDARLQAFATVYAAGGQVNGGSLYNWNADKAEEALRDFVNLVG